MAPTRPATDPAPDHGTTVLDPARRRARLDTLLDLRAVLGQLAAERRSHRLDDRDEVYQAMLHVEALLLELDPAVHADRLPRWLEEYARLEHTPRSLPSDCVLCRAITRARATRLDPPAA